jgi:hypothetical protein
MRTETAPVYKPQDGMATVVFARHTNFGGAINFVAVDQNRKFVAGMKGKAHAVTMLPPGQYVFYIVAENTDIIRATLEAGRTYVIEARVRMGFWKAQVTAESVRRNTPRFTEAPTWINGTPALVPDGSSGQQWVDGHADNIAKRIDKVNAAFDQKDPEWQAQHTLAPEDGYLPDEFKVVAAN